MREGASCSVKDQAARSPVTLSTPHEGRSLNMASCSRLTPACTSTCSETLTSPGRRATSGVAGSFARVVQPVSREPNGKTGVNSRPSAGTRSAVVTSKIAERGVESVTAYDIRAETTCMVGGCSTSEDLTAVCPPVMAATARADSSTATGSGASAARHAPSSPPGARQLSLASPGSEAGAVGSGAAAGAAAAEPGPMAAAASARSATRSGSP
mmetsp:Transcript_25269/g.54920  ORF Transcript_25269/g.54920 Transcript_25269/m.54920 type:complete len:212 (-) Transcript_25269:2157-2792(-)